MNLKRLLVVCIALAAIVCVAVPASAQQPSPVTGAWKAKAKDTPDAVGFRVAETDKGYRISAIRLRAATSCVNTKDPGSGVAARRIRVTLPAVNLKRSLRNGRTLKMLRFDGRRNRGLPGGRKQAVHLKVRFVADRDAKVFATVVDRGVAKNPLRCTARLRLRAHPGRG